MYSELKNVEIPLVKTIHQRLGWDYVSSDQLDTLRQTYDNPFILDYLVEAIVKLNGEKGITEDLAKQVVRKLHQVDDNEEFTKWLKGEKSFKPSPSKKAVTIRLIDFDNIENNRFTITNQFTQSITKGAIEGEKHIRPDIVLMVNGIPTTVIECKVISTEGSVWEEGVKQLDRYQRHSPDLFKANCFNVSTDGHILKYGATGSLSQYFFEWKYDNGLPADFDEEHSEFAKVNGDEPYNPYIDRAVYGLFNKQTYLDIIANFIIFETNDDITIKKVCRYQQYRATNKIVERVLKGKMKTGLIWHTQGSGKSLTMLFTAWKLRKHPALNNPTVLIVVDRRDLDTQIAGVFVGANLPNICRANSIRELRKKLKQDRREIIITTVFKFSEMKDVLVKRENVIVMVDEAHRSQEGLNAIEMRSTLKNAFFIGFTGTPIDRADKNTHRNFGMKPGGTIERYLDLYNIKQAIEDGATVPVHYQLRNSRWHIDDADIDKIIEAEYDHLEDEALDELKKKASSYYTFMMMPDRLKSIAKDIAEHFENHVKPNQYKAQIVCFTRLACVIIKSHLDKLLAPQTSDIIYTGTQNDDDELRQYHYTADQQKQIVSNFKHPEHPLKILLVQSMLLTGFDAPVEQVMYLDRPLRDHNLLQAIARTNRPYKDKQCGVIVDYCGVLKHLEKALNFNEDEIESCLIDFDELKQKLPDLIDEFKNLFAGVDKANLWHCLKHIEKNKLEAQVKSVYKKLQTTYETIAPDPFVLDYQPDYKWATEIIVALRQLNDNNKPNINDYLANTQKLIQDHIDIGKIDTTAPVFVVDDNYLRRIDELPGDKEQREILLEKRLRSVLRGKLGNLPIYKSLMDRLKAIVEQKDQETQDTLERLKKLTGEVNEAIKQEEASGLSKGEMAIKQLVAEKVAGYGNGEELASKIAGCIKDRVFSGWQSQATVRSSIKRDIILELAMFAKDHPEVKLDPDDYSKFSREAMKYVERHF